MPQAADAQGLVLPLDVDPKLDLCFVFATDQIVPGSATQKTRLRNRRLVSSGIDLPGKGFRFSDERHEEAAVVVVVGKEAEASVQVKINVVGRRPHAYEDHNETINGLSHDLEDRIGELWIKQTKQNT